MRRLLWRRQIGRATRRAAAIMDVSVRWTEPSGRQTAATLCPMGPSEWSLPIQLSDILGERIFEIEAVDATGNRRTQRGSFQR